MFSVLVWVAFIALSSAVPTIPVPCCSDSSFTAIVSAIRWLDVQDSTEPTVSDFVANITYDYVQQKEVLTIPPYPSDHTVTIINDYKTSKMYTIDPSGQCTVSPLDIFMIPNCIPADFTYGGTVTTGSGSQGTTINSFSGQLGDVTMHMQKTADNCTPVAVNMYRKTGAVKFLFTFMFANVVPGPVTGDPFAIPASCNV